MLTNIVVAIQDFGVGKTIASVAVIALVIWVIIAGNKKGGGGNNGGGGNTSQQG